MTPEPGQAQRRPATVPIPSDGLKIALMVLAGCVAVLSAVSSVGTIVVTDKITGGTPADDLPLPLLAFQMGPALLIVPLIIGSWIVAGIWLMQAQDAARALYPHTEQRRAKAWSLLGWIVPIANLFVPSMLVNDLLRAARGAAGALAGWWWTCWLAMLIANRVQSQALDLRPGEDGGQIVFFAGIGVVAALAGGLLWIRIISTIAEGLEDPDAHQDYARRTPR